MLAILPLDIARCLGRRDVSPAAELCPRRATCLRHLDTPRRAPGDQRQWPVEPWVCSDNNFAAHRPMPQETMNAQ